METQQNPFSLYDFLGYLIPGLTALYGIVIFYKLGHNVDKAWDILLSYQKLGKFELYIPFFLLAYILGHILSFCSSISIEKYSIVTLGYPSKYMLNISPKPFFDKNHVARSIKRLIGTLLIFPISFSDILIGHYMGFRKLYVKELDTFLTHTIRTKILQYVYDNYDFNENRINGEEEKDYFRLLYHYVLENCPSHVSKLNNYVALYGFTRTLCFVAVCFVWLSIICYLFELISAGKIAIIWSVMIPASFILYMAFNKFHRRYTLEVLMALSVSYKK